MANSLHQMRLAQARAAVDEQRVVGLARILGHLHGRGLGKVVALAFDEQVEGGVRIQPHAHLQRRLGHDPPCRAAWWFWHRSRNRGRAGIADFHPHGHVHAARLAQQGGDAWRGMLLEPSRRHNGLAPAGAAGCRIPRPAAAAARCLPAVPAARQPVFPAPGSRVLTFPYEGGPKGKYSGGGRVYSSGLNLP